MNGEQKHVSLVMHVHLKRCLSLVQLLKEERLISTPCLPAPNHLMPFNEWPDPVLSSTWQKVPNLDHMHAAPVVQRCRSKQHPAAQRSFNNGSSRHVTQQKASYSLPRLCQLRHCRYQR